MDSLPNVLYQYINIVPDINQDSIQIETIIWIAYKDPIIAGSKIYLHCRQCRLKEVYVNNIPVPYILNDPLKSLAYDINSNNKKQSFLTEELDVNYRAALEITRKGELEIIIPDDIQLNGTLNTPKPIPRSSPKDVIGRYEKLLKLYNMLISYVPPTPKHNNHLRTNQISSNQSPSNLSDDGSLDSSQISENEGKARTNFIQVRIVYELNSKDITTTGEIKSRMNSGYIFRHKPPLVDLFETTLGKNKKLDKHINKNRSYSTVESIFTTLNNMGTLRDVDGIRCWLPCLDALDQRAIYDISITMPMNWKVSCSGKKLSTYLVNNTNNNHVHTTKQPMIDTMMIPMKISRFFTANRIPAMSVGFFIGRIESYSMSLYKVKARIWVAKGLNDFESKDYPKTKKEFKNVSNPAEINGVIGDHTTDEEDYSNDDDGDEEDKIAFIKKLDGTYYASYKRRLNNSSTTVTTIEEDNNVNTTESSSSPPYKKIRTTTQDTMENASRKFYSMEAPLSKVAGASIPTTKESKLKQLKKSRSTSELYQEQVHHSTLGLDMALRLIHKFVNLKYDSDTYTFIFVHELGKDFMSFDGFTLIDAKYLHTSQQVYIESTAHLLLIEAYLYSWIKSSLPLCSYEVEFIIHGVVGYLLNFYSEEVYGEEDGKYRYQKIYDTVVRLEMQGRGYPISSFYPESFEVFNPFYGLYLKCKSTVLFHLIENRAGGKDPMRVTLKHIIRSPPLHNTHSSQRQINYGSNIEVINNFQSLFNTTSGVIPSSPSLMDSVLKRQRSNSDDMSSSYSGGAMSPYMQLGAGTPYSGNLSPYIISKDVLPYLYNNQNENLSPYLKQGNMSPYSAYGNMSPYSHQPYGNMSPYSHQPYGNMSPYAAAYVGGSYTPAAAYYDPYTMYAGTAAAAHTNISYAPDRYEVTQSETESRYEVSHSPIVQSIEPADAENEIKKHVDINENNKEITNDSKQGIEEIDSFIESNSNENNQIDTSQNTTAVANDNNTNSSVATLVNEAGISAMGGGYYATLARRDERVRSNSFSMDLPSTNMNRSRSNSYSGSVNHENSAEQLKLKLSLKRQDSQTSDASVIVDPTEQIFHLLNNDCVSADSFILTLRHASGVSADIDNSFLDKYVYKSGVLFIRLHVSISPKVDAKPRHIYVVSQQVGMKQGGDVDNAYANEEVLKLRIAETRDDFVTEPMIRFCDIIEQYQQQAYSRPGRRAGFRRIKTEDTSNMSTEEIAELIRKEKILEERKSALQRVRDVDYAIKYVLLDPTCLDIADVLNSSSDLLLIEQLYTDFYEHSVYFQCQALRSLARSSPSNELLYIENRPEPNELTTSSSSSSKLNSSILEKSPKLQIKTFVDCLLGLPTKIQDAKCIDGPQFCIYVRAEAAFALAQWQNDNAPRSISTDTAKDATSIASSHWLGMKALIDILKELYIDSKTNIPLPSDFSNETFTYLRNAILLALSTIKSQSGVTPLEVVEVLLLFFSQIEDDIAIDIDQVNKTTNTNSSRYDDKHYRTILFLALSKIRFESITSSHSTIHSNHAPTINDSGSSLSHPIHKIISIAKNTINIAFTQARAAARIKYQSNHANFLPYLPGNGIDVAAAISCLAEMDIQAIEMIANGRSMNTLDARELENPHPTGIGLLTKFDYLKYIFPSEIELKCAPRFLSSHHIPNTESKKNILKDKLSFCLCTPVIRAAAFEAFVRICFALQYGYIERIKSLHMKNNLQSTTTNTIVDNTNPSKQQHNIGLKASDSTYIAATIEALLEILKQDGNNLWLKQQAALIISETIMDRPARITIQSISMNNFWYCYGSYWSDPYGLTIVPHTILHLLKSNTVISNIKDKSVWKVGNGKKAMLSSGSNLKMAIKLYWRYIMMSANFDQSIRSILVNAWIYAFGKDIPKIIKETNDELKQFSDNFFHNQLTEDRLDIKNPLEVSSLINKSLKYGIIIAKDNDPDNNYIDSSNNLEITTTSNIVTNINKTIQSIPTNSNVVNNITSSTNNTDSFLSNNTDTINNHEDKTINKDVESDPNIVKSPLKLTFKLNSNKSVIRDSNSNNNTTSIAANNNHNNTMNSSATINQNNTKQTGEKKTTLRFVL